MRFVTPLCRPHAHARGAPRERAAPAERSAPATDAALQFFTELVDLNDPKAFAAALAPLRTAEWVVYAKKPYTRTIQ
jgi:hypothetical protein